MSFGFCGFWLGDQVYELCGFMWSPVCLGEPAYSVEQGAVLEFRGPFPGVDLPWSGCLRLRGSVFSVRQGSM